MSCDNIGILLFSTTPACIEWQEDDLQLISIIVCVAAFGLDGGLAAIFDVMKNGAHGDGMHDDTQAFLQAWKAVCTNCGVSSRLIVPKGRTFLLSPVKFTGPCKTSHVYVQILGNIVAPKEIGAWKGCESDSWLSFSDIQGLVVVGSGKIDGQGSLWWKDAGRKGIQTYENNQGCDRPTALHFHGCDDLKLRGLRHINSPKNHISINRCNGVTISGLHIFAPESSPNTDGIDISASTHVSISDSIIQTGDDCVAINTGSSDIKITGVSCGPGHGISVGSLGANGSYATVEHINVKGCNFNGSQNGIRIKTWPGGSGYAMHINFENITVRNVKNPVIIDQFYCNGEFKCEDKSSAVQVSNVTYKGVKGSSIGKDAIQLACSKSKPCTNITMEEINIVSAVPGAKTHALCKNVRGEVSSTAPTVSCLA